MSNEKLRVLAKGTAQVPNYEAQGAGVNGRVSHACLPLGPEFMDDETHTKRRHMAYIKHVGRVVEVPDRAEYRRHLQAGDLYPADLETATKCGVKFDPDFGDEHNDEAKAEHKAALMELAGSDQELMAHVARVLPVDSKESR